MFDYLRDNLKDRPDIIRSVLEEQLSMLKYFLEVFNYNKVSDGEDIPEGLQIFYLDYRTAKKQALLGITKLEEILNTLED